MYVGTEGRVFMKGVCILIKTHIYTYPYIGPVGRRRRRRRGPPPPVAPADAPGARDVHGREPLLGAFGCARFGGVEDCGGG
jgi:hypothetical protein